MDNLYDAVQILAKCILLTTPDRRVLEAKSHGFIEAKLNLHGKLGNVNAKSVRLLNRLTQLRPQTRYSTEPPTLPGAELKSLLQDAQSMRQEVEDQRPTRKLVPDFERPDTSLTP